MTVGPHFALQHRNTFRQVFDYWFLLVSVLCFFEQMTSFKGFMSHSEFPCQVMVYFLIAFTVLTEESLILVTLLYKLTIVFSGERAKLGCEVQLCN